MFKKFNLFVLFFLIAFAKGQFISELPESSTLGKYSHEHKNYIDSGISSKRFIINHGFSTSMISDGRNFYSISGIDNSFSYSLSKNLTLKFYHPSSFHIRSDEV